MPCCRANNEEKNLENRDKSGCCSEINKDMTIESILGLFPHKSQKLSQEINNAGLHCIGCQAAVWETLEVGMLSHGKTEEQIEDLVSRLNRLLKEESDLNTISITERAAQKFAEILESENKQGWGMRFSEELAGCSGYEFVLDFSEKSEPEDEDFTAYGVEIHVNKAQLSRLMGSEIDYVDGLRGAGFKISNPNVKASCGCGSSHNY